MRELISDEKLVAACGLYCGAYLRERCPGCAGNEKAAWCAVRKCCRERNYSTCAECADFKDPADCAKLNNFISKVIGLFTKSDRPASLRRIRAAGRAAYAAERAAARTHSVRKN